MSWRVKKPRTIFAWWRNYWLIIAGLSVLVVTLGMVVFSTTNTGQMQFLVAFDMHNHYIAWLTIGLGGLACLVVAIGQNVAGEALQATTNNQLASPFTFGMTSAMTLAYLSLSFTNPPWWAIIPLGWLFLVVLSVLPQYLLWSFGTKLQVQTTVLYGLALTIFLNALIVTLAYVSKPLDFNVYGWMFTTNTTFSSRKLIAGALITFCGLIGLLCLLKKLHVLTTSRMRASSLGTNVQTLHLGVMVATTFLCLGAFVAYAPFTLIGLGLPYLTKRYLLRRADVRYSLLPSTLLTIIILWSAYLLRLHFALDTNALAIILFLPLVLMTCHLPSRKKVSRKTKTNYETA